MAIKPFNYPIAINAEVTKSTQINDNNSSFVIQFTSNITTWEITHTLSDFQQLHEKLRDYKPLQSIKLPRNITQIPSSKFKESHKQIIQEYLWKLLRRAYIFISLPLQTFIQLPIIMKQQTNYMSKQLNIIIRDDIILYSIQNDNKYINIQCILRSSYIFDAYKVIQNNDDYLIRNELNEGFGDNKNKLLFRIDVVQIKRVLKYQKEFKFAIETRKGIMYAFKCKNKMQFNHWLKDIKNMIKAQAGCTPYLNKWENNRIEGAMHTGHTIQIQRRTDDHSAVKVTFFATLSPSKYEITEIQNISNKNAVTIYESILNTKCQAKNVKPSQMEQFLWHGIKGNNCNDILEKILKNGFDRSYNKVGHFGKGTYFARHSKYSVKYDYCGQDDNG
eukprot:294776_1